MPSTFATGYEPTFEGRCAKHVYPQLACSENRASFDATATVVRRALEEARPGSSATHRRRLLLPGLDRGEERKSTTFTGGRSWCFPPRLPSCAVSVSRTRLGERRTRLAPGTYTTPFEVHAKGT